MQQIEFESKLVFALHVLQYLSPPIQGGHSHVILHYDHSSFTFSKLDKGSYLIQQVGINGRLEFESKVEHPSQFQKKLPIPIKMALMWGSFQILEL